MDSKTRARLVEVAETVIYNLESDDSETALPWAVELVDELRKVEAQRVKSEKVARAMAQLAKIEIREPKLA